MVQRPKSPVAVVVVLAILVVLVGLYVAGYFGLSKSFVGSYEGKPTFVRTYPHPLVGWLYYPAALVEAKCQRQYGVIAMEGGKALYTVAP